MEKEAFERELLALTDTLYRVSASILPRQCDREDAIQESILTALQKRERLRDDGALRAWVVRILVNNCYDILRSQKSAKPACRPIRRRSCAGTRRRTRT